MEVRQFVMQYIYIILSILRKMKYEKLKQLIFLKGSEEKIIDILNTSEKIDFIQYVDANNNTALHYAISNRHLQVIKIYLKLLARKQSWTDKYQGVTDQVMRYKANLWINTKNIDGLTALHYASAQGFISGIKLLEDVGARLDLITNDGLNVFSLAAQRGKIQSMLYFDGKVDTNATDLKKCSSLHWATYNNEQPIVKYLVTRYKTQLDFQQEQGRTALHLAVLYQKANIVETLLIGGANRWIKDNNSKTAYDYALVNQNQKILHLLTQKQSGLCNKKAFAYAPQPVQKIHSVLYVFIFLYAICFQNYILISIYQQANKTANNQKWIGNPFTIFFIESLLITFCLILYLYIFYKKPNIDKLSFSQISENIENINDLCFYCKNFQDEGIHHCHLCNKCVNFRLKHNTFLKCCVGKHNQIAYFILLFFAFLVAFLIIRDGALLLVEFFNNNSQELNSETVFMISSYFMIGIDFSCLFSEIVIAREIYVVLKIRRKMRSILYIKELSETTFNSSSTLLARKISMANTKAKKFRKDSKKNNY